MAAMFWDAASCILAWCRVARYQHSRGAPLVNVPPKSTCLLQALLQSSHMYAEAKHAFQKHGVLVDGVAVDVAAMQRQKANAVEGLTKGIEGLFKKNKASCELIFANQLWPQACYVQNLAGHRTLMAQKKNTVCSAAPHAGPVCAGVGQAAQCD